MAQYEQPGDVQNAIALPGYRLAVRFFDGTSGIVDLSGIIAKGGAFAALRDPAVFSAVTITLGTVTWPNGADLAPDAMHATISAAGQWKPF